MEQPDTDLERILLRNALANDPQGLFFSDRDGRIIRAGQAFAYAVGVEDPDALVGRTARDWLPPDVAERVIADQDSIVRTGVPVIELHDRVRNPNGQDTWIATTRHPLRDDEGRIIGVFGVLQDITARRLMEGRLQAQAAEMAQANSELRRAEAELRAILEATPDPTVRMDPALRIVYVNPAVVELWGGVATDMMGRTLRDLAPGRAGEATIGAFETTLRQVLETGEAGEIEGALPIEGGSVYLHTRVVAERDRMGSVSGLLLFARDLTARKRVEDLLAERALRDPLTGLANRVLLFDRLRRALLRMDRRPGSVAVLFLDLDRFKGVNDSAGHSGGDALLVEVARRLKVCARASDTVARFGGDEFVMLCEEVSGDDGVTVVAERILAEMHEPFVYAGEKIRPSMSIGIAVADHHDIDAEGLVRDADAAMYQAKARRTGGYQIFDSGVRDEMVSRVALENDLRRAIDEGELRLVYQPILRLADQRMVGIEALLRWRRREGGDVSPAVFIPLAEESGLIVRLGEWVIEEAIGQLAAWNATLPPGTEPLTMAVNVSARQLGHATLADVLARALDRHLVPARQLIVEITETAMLEESLLSGEVFLGLKRLGVRLALDDFGTGYSSLGHLQRLPVDVLKIDRMFVDGLDGGHGQAAIVAGVTAMARALGITTVGEGIETPRQLEVLRELGCDEGQGFLLARPQEVADLDRAHLAPLRRGGAGDDGGAGDGGGR